MTDYIINEKGTEVISERHQKDYKREYEKSEVESTSETETSTESFSFNILIYFLQIK